MSSFERCQGFGHQRLSSVWSSLAEDLHRHLNKSPENRAAGSGLKQRLGGILTPHLVCLFIYRTSHFLYVRGWRGFAWWLSTLNSFTHRIQIPPDSCIGPGCFLPHPAAVTFYGTAGNGLTIYSAAVCCPRNAGAGSIKGPWLGDDVTLGGHSVVLGDIKVADGTFLSFGVAVNRDIPFDARVFTNAAHPRVSRDRRNQVREELPAP